MVHPTAGQTSTIPLNYKQTVAIVKTNNVNN